ncbi:unnamed protein product [Arabidopsis thaliana]|uniref:(thale cress) hypothetical protein n=1 Tax=Arabidopsis thaliana TaxID=3702 RepID=A0A7G2E851_ARATH|nr:unnamed protein product [Arabidopsis thaliana]
MELKEQGMSMRLSLVLGNALVLNCAALALTATMLSSLLELFSQVTVLKGDVIENGYEVVDAVEGNGNNDDSGDDGGEDEEGSADDAEGKETKKGPPPKKRKK